jgi:hypothetical protein
MAPWRNQKKEISKLRRRIQDAQNKPRLITNETLQNQSFTPIDGNKCMIFNMTTGEQRSDIPNEVAMHIHGLGIDVHQNTSVTSHTEHDNPCYSVWVGGDKLAIEYTKTDTDPVNGRKFVMLPSREDLQKLFINMHTDSIFVMAIKRIRDNNTMHCGVFDDYKTLNVALRELNRPKNDITQEYKPVNLWNHKTVDTTKDKETSPVNEGVNHHQVTNSSIKLKKNFGDDTDDAIIYHEFTIAETKDIKKMLNSNSLSTGTASMFPRGPASMRSFSSSGAFSRRPM